jgi:hypothetical protein
MVEPRGAGSRISIVAGNEWVLIMVKSSKWL